MNYRFFIYLFLRRNYKRMQEVYKKDSRKIFSANLERQIFEIFPSEQCLGANHGG